LTQPTNWLYNILCLKTIQLMFKNYS
jgi:hypothetical protein